MIARELVQRAVRKAQGAQATVSRSESTDVSFENDKLKSTQSSQRTQINVKVILDGKIGTSYTTDVSDIEGVVSRALEAAEFGSTAHFEFPAPEKRMDFEIIAVWYKPDGSVMARQTKEAYIDSDWKNSYHNFGRGWREPGKWAPGIYVVDLLIGDQPIASGSFTIFQ